MPQGQTPEQPSAQPAGAGASGRPVALCARYAVADTQWDNPVDGTALLTVIGPAPGGLVEWELELSETLGGPFAIRAISEHVPMTRAEGPGRFAGYLLRDREGKVTSYRHRRTGEPLLPCFHFVSSFLPVLRAATPLFRGFGITGELLGQSITLRDVSEVPLPAAWRVDHDLRLDPDIRIGMWWCAKDDGTGQNADKEYRYVAYSADDWDTMIRAGCNDLSAYPQARSLLENREVFFRCEPDFPLDFYRSNYAGQEMFVDEPAIHLIWRKPAETRAYHPAQLAEILVSMNRAAFGPNGIPYAMQRSLQAKPRKLGSLDLRVDGLPVWETEFSTAFYQMMGGAGGMVHEGRYGGWDAAVRDDGRIDWGLDAVFGAPVTLSPEAYLRCHFAFLRGAARVFNRWWGTSIYGQCAPELRLPALTLAYDMGARWFWLWTGDHDHHLLQTEKVRLAQGLNRHAADHPRRPIEDLRAAATTAVALPWGYMLSIREMWNHRDLELGRPNPVGVPYRDVLAAAVREGLRCAERAEEFDFVVDIPGLDRLGYVRIVRVDEHANLTQWPLCTEDAPPRAAPADGGPL